jgi:hypothetical protein
MKPTRPPNDQGGESAGLIDTPEFDFNTPAYVQFSEHLDVQLTQLVALWQHLAAPNALRIDRGTFCSGRSRSPLT